LYVYIDVNRNRSLGYTWYHEDDEYGSAAEIVSGKGERLVLLTAITKEYGMLRCVDDDWTPPYHPELQHIEELWRDVKQYVARKYVGLRSMTDLRKHVLEGFLRVYIVLSEIKE